VKEFGSAYLTMIGSAAGRIRHDGQDRIVAFLSLSTKP